MSDKRNLTVVVSDKDRNKTTFVLRIHQSEKDEDRHLELSWYKENGNGFVPVGLQYEVETLSVQPDCRERKDLNFHKSVKDGTFFMCYPGPLPTEEETATIVALWAVGTVHTVRTGEALNDVIKRLKLPSLGEVIAWYKSEQGYSLTMQPNAS